MRRLLAMITALLLCAVPALAEAEIPLLTQIITGAQKLSHLAEDEAYLRQYISDEALLARIASWPAGDEARPTAAYAVDLAPAWAAVKAAEDGLQEGSEAMLQNLLPSMVMSELQGNDGACASTFVVISEYLQAPGVSGQGVYILLYEDACPVITGWFANGQIAYIRAAYLPDADLSALSWADRLLPVELICEWKEEP